MQSSEKRAQDLLNHLAKSTTWVAGALFVTAAAWLADKSQPVGVGTEIPERYFGMVSYAALCALAFVFTRYAHMLRTVVEQAGADDAVLEAVRTHPWSLSPFGKLGDWTNPLDRIIDIATTALGSALLIALWWAGFHIGLLALLEDTYHLAFAIPLFLYVGLAALSMYTLQRIERRVVQCVRTHRTQRASAALTLLAAGVYTFSILW